MLQVLWFILKNEQNHFCGTWLLVVVVRNCLLRIAKVIRNVLLVLVSSLWMLIYVNLLSQSMPPLQCFVTLSCMLSLRTTTNRPDEHVESQPMLSYGDHLQIIIINLKMWVFFSSQQAPYYMLINHTLHLI